MWIKNLLGAKPRLVFSVDSPHSGKINVWEDRGSLTLEVGGYPQSVTLDAPDFSERYWARAVGEVGKRLVKPRRALLVGVGGGTIPQLLSQKFPGLSIVGVELDPQIIQAARKFFGLDKIRKLEVVIGDGAAYVKEYKGEKFDLTFVDAYIGGDFPSTFTEEEVLRKLREITNPQGLIIINRASGFDKLAFKKLLASIFAKVETVKIPLPGFLGGLGGNFLFFCR